ncbi:unnamed protein product [Heterobilharzia americana]|nr:unnamed protein product [Heterobilharzia americana]CAH8454637.1 unnamed protein product [Heterobilharzia americana]
MMKNQSELGEELNEACSIGVLEEVVKLVTIGADVNHQNKVNGMTPLHWAYTRKHQNIIDYLLSRGADPDITRSDGKKPHEMQETIKTSFVPNYLESPSFPYVKINQNDHPVQSSCLHESILKIRLAQSEEEDFYEFEAPVQTCSYDHFIQIISKELNIIPDKIKKIRKLPNTVVRCETDLRRLSNGTELEVVLID